MIDEKKLIEDLEKAKSNCKHFYELVFFDGVMAIVDTQPKLNGWIPVSERLPEKEEYLKNDGRFIVTDGNRRYQGWFDIYDGHFAKTSRDDVMKEDKCVIAWQPLPSVWKGENNG